MFCGNCGAEIENNAQFCGKCGARAGEVIASPPVVNVPQSAPQTVAQPISQPVVPPPVIQPIPQPVVALQPVPPPPGEPGYYLSINQRESGPFSLGQIKTMIQSGQLTLAYWVCQAGSNVWIPINEVPELRAAFSGQVQYQSQAQYIDTSRLLRHGFTSFWLWISIITNIIGFFFIIVGFFLYDEYEEWIGELLQYIYPAINFKTLFYWAMAIMAAMIFGLWKIINKWQRNGFYWLVAAYSANIVLYFIYAPGEAGKTILGHVIYLGITFGILQFRNVYNKSTWEQLE